jgi:hypothetical protein
VYGQFNFLDTVAASQQEMARQIQMAFPTPSTFPGNFFSQHQLLQAQQNALLQSQFYARLQEASVTSTPAALDSVPFGALFDGSVPSSASASIQSVNSSNSGMLGIQGQLGGAETSGCNGPLLDNDTMSMWSSAPTSFEYVCT